MSGLKPPRFKKLSLTCDVATYIGLLIFVLALPFGYTTTFLNIGLAFVLLGWIGRIAVDRKLGWQRTPLDLPIVLFLGLGLIAAALAPHPDTSSLGYFWKHLRAILLFYAVIHSRLGVRWRHVVVAFIAAAGISAALGLWYYANDTRLAIDFMGRVGLQFQEELTAGTGFSDELRAELRDCNVPLSETATFVAAHQQDTWRIDDPARARRYTIRKGETDLLVYMIEQRLTGTFKMPNDLGAYLALALPFVFGYFVAGCSGIIVQRRQSPAFLIGATVSLGAILAAMSANLGLTLTRAAWVSVSVALLFIGGCSVVRVLRARILWKQGLLVLALISAVLFTFIVNTGSRQGIRSTLPPHITDRLETLITQPAGFMGERPQWWRVSLQMLREHPLTGIGLGRFRYEYQHKGPEVQYTTPYHAHNIYLHIAVEQGFPSLCVFLWLMALVCRQIFGMRNADDLWKMGTFIGASGFLISALVYGLADNILHQRTVLLFWFILGIIFYSDSVKDTPYEKTPDPD